MSTNEMTGFERLLDDLAAYYGEGEYANDPSNLCYQDGYHAKAVERRHGGTPIDVLKKQVEEGFFAWKKATLRTALKRLDAQGKVEGVRAIRIAKQSRLIHAWVTEFEKEGPWAAFVGFERDVAESAFGDTYEGMDIDDKTALFAFVAELLESEAEGGIDG